MKNMIKQLICCLTAMASFPFFSVTVNAEDIQNDSVAIRGTFTTQNVTCLWDAYNVKLTDANGNAVTDANYVITCAMKDSISGEVTGYELVHVNRTYHEIQRVYLYKDMAYNRDIMESSLGNTSLKVGQLIKAYGDVTDMTTAEMRLINKAEADFKAIEVIGQGTDLFGNEFDKCVHDLMSAQWRKNPFEENDFSGTTLYTGDVNESDSIDIIDVIVLNKHLLGANSLCTYAKLVADVDRNGTIDSTDSLTLLKEVVGVTTNFVEQ